MGLGKSDLFAEKVFFQIFLDWLDGLGFFFFWGGGVMVGVFWLKEK